MGTISFSGLGSGIDIDSIVTGLLRADSGGITKANSRIAASKAAVSDLSSISGLLADLKSTVDSMDTATELASYSGTSAKPEALSLTTSASASPASYSVRVVSLVKEQRNYSTTFASQSDDLNKTGTLRLTQGGTDYDVDVQATDSLSDIAVKINSSGAKIKANVFFDGSQYRLQLSGSQAGADGAFSINDVTASLGLGYDAVDSQKQAASDAEIIVDGISVKSKTNSISGAVDGVTFNLTQETADFFQAKVASDPTQITTALKAFVQKYNAVANKIHQVAGYGKIKASNDELAGDSALRAVSSGLTNRVLGRSGQGGALDTLADVGLRLNNDGTLRLDEAKMKKALSDHPEDFAKVLAGTDTSDGLMDVMGSMLKSFTQIGDGLIASRQDSFNSRIKTLQDTVTREQTRLDRMETRLRSTFNAMDTAVARSQNQLSYLYSLG